MFSTRSNLISKARSLCAIRNYSNVVTEANGFDEIPSPRRLPIVGTTLSLIAAGGPAKLHEYVDNRHRQLGPIYREKIGPVSAVFISDPEYMRTVFGLEGKYPMHVLPQAWLVYNKLHEQSRGLFFMEGEEWLHFRRIMNKHLLKGDTKWIEECCDLVTDLMVQRFKASSDKDTVFTNLEQELYLSSIHIIIAILLGAEAYEKSYIRIKMLSESLASKVHLIFETTSKLSLLPTDLAAKLNIPAWKRFESSVRSALNISGILVDIMLDQCPNGDGLLSKLREEKVDRKDITRIVSDLVLAAGDTTAYSMEWILYSVAKNPHVQEQLRGLRKDERSNALKNVVKETLRLYPVAPFLTRFLPEDSVIGGYRIPAMTPVILSIYTSGRDPRYFADPGDFRPDRWIRTDSGTVNRSLMRHATIPFALGARSCIGRKIAETQLQMTLGKIIDNFRVVLCNKREVDVILKMVVVPSEPLQLKFISI